MGSLSADTIYADLKGKTVYITGGASGIGAGLVRAFCAQSCKVIFTDINTVAGDKFCAEMVGSDVSFEELDVTDIPALKRSIKNAGNIDILINNVANDLRHDPLEISHEQWRDLTAVNLDVTFFASQTALENMTQTGGGVIINLGSINGRLAPIGMPAYVAAKAGIEALTKALAKEYGGQGVRVNAIAPGWVATEKQLEQWLTPDVEAEWNTHLALTHRRILPSDVAKLALFLASDESEMITGQSIVIDAGRT